MAVTRPFPLWQTFCMFCFHNINNNTTNICFAIAVTKVRDASYFIKRVDCKKKSRLGDDEQTIRSGDIGLVNVMVVWEQSSQNVITS